MKKYIVTSFLLFAVIIANAQVSIGKESINGTSTILDFYDVSDNFRGIILPAVDATPTVDANNNGTFLFDTSEKKLKMYEAGVWKDLSGEGNILNLQSNSSAEHNTKDQGVIIGSETSLAKGVLVLESANKALILPKISNPHTTVKSPYPGMMCYDTASKSLALFDGNVWNYWK